jgi:hypothetical protein
MHPKFLEKPKCESQSETMGEKKGVGAHSLTHNISRVGRCAGIPRWDYDKLTSKSSR